MRRPRWRRKGRRVTMCRPCRVRAPGTAAYDTCHPCRKSVWYGWSAGPGRVRHRRRRDRHHRAGAGVAAARSETIHVQPVESYVGHTGHGVTLGCHLLGLHAGLADVIGRRRGAGSARLRGAPAAAARRAPPQRHAAIGQPRVARRPPPLLVRRPPPGRTPGRPGSLADKLVRARHVHVSIMEFARHALPDDSPRTAPSPPTCTTGTAGTTITRTSRSAPTSSSSRPARCRTTRSTGSSPTAGPRP